MDAAECIEVDEEHGLYVRHAGHVAKLQTEDGRTVDILPLLTSPAACARKILRAAIQRYRAALDEHHR